MEAASSHLKREPLTNREVYDMLRQRTDLRMSQGKVTAPVEQNALAYLEEHMGVNAMAAMTPAPEELFEGQTPEKIGDFLRSVEHFDFSEEEKLQLINLRPRTELELSLIVWGLQEWPEGQAVELLTLIAEGFAAV
eukprot:TRINITY_DN2793_c0_g1_i4.p2 TRINITY_DN2793_c0_g1~~TRINITY_DN2793_c0_g1_i4.p2  ORF type:complete len:136 (+),score=33.13 TRINITY_DN2793_c0_g1_i4:221-628(+)